MAQEHKKTSRMSTLGFPDFFSRLENALKTDLRYKEEAYLFVMSGLDRAVRKLKKPRHVSGRELVKSLGEEALEQFGPMATTVLEHWGIKNSLDFGHIVFNMVREGILAKTEDDRLEDFEDGISFENIFDQSGEYHLKNETVPSKTILKK